ncbi:WD-repeat cell cycle regulatory protein (macronuclear) [Tetrahymena thermophila SB210]|uniref:WD-repeat cell cycle regulatory protein n=1 Tax=Tetrahymena thermophila (strain SB210) TaxID=312017 RepID=Q23KJ2_TETTS|nr:WD-repeat cell cycle regulatory protein [Tetrahymena thermophila SB210]EAR96851.1 WD-repeat cell cycle regulatory protein [Tetrahymena thermophila SB210]|eukprot:XP_001017096.1 WD-repeat cell cycle regulatory protein [Tetrahymena thermophila SB210]
MEEQVYQKEADQLQESLKFYDPDTKKIRGYLSDKTNSDEYNRVHNNFNVSASNNYPNFYSSNNTQMYFNSINDNQSVSNTLQQSQNNSKFPNNHIENQQSVHQQTNFNQNSKVGEECLKQPYLFQVKPIIFDQSSYNYQEEENQVWKVNKKLQSEASESLCQTKTELNKAPSIYLSQELVSSDSSIGHIFNENALNMDKNQSQQIDSDKTQIYFQTYENLSNNESTPSHSQQSSLQIINNENSSQLEIKSNASGQKQKSSGKKYNDRYIPNRVSTNLYNLINPTQLSSSSSQQNSNSSQQPNGDEIDDGTMRRQSDNPRVQQNSKLYSNLLQSSILGESPELLQQSRHWGSSNADYILKDSQMINYGQINAYQTYKQKKILTYSTKQQIQNYENELKIAAHNQIILSHEQNIRKIPKQPYKILESRNLQDDFYLNLLDWSPLNYLAVGLKNQVAIWSGCNSTISRLCGLGDVGVSSVSCSQRSNHIAVGDSIGNILIYDIHHKEQPLLKIDGHSDRIGSIAWNGSLIASGSKDKNILVRDLRAPQKYIQKYSGHKQEICGLKWSFDENILASGGNDNKLFLWTLKTKDELAKFSQHTAAVKALGFSPHQHNILASGGGTADRCIRFWNTQTLQQIDCLDTGSQVCNLMFSKNVNEIVSTHGYSLNQIIVWKYPSMKKIQTLTGHTQRVLYLAMSPCGQNVVTGAGDETLRFWNIFPSVKNKSNLLGTSSLFPSCIDLR